MPNPKLHHAYMSAPTAKILAPPTPEFAEFRRIFAAPCSSGNQTALFRCNLYTFCDSDTAVQETSRRLPSAYRNAPKRTDFSILAPKLPY